MTDGCCGGLLCRLSESLTSAAFRACEPGPATAERIISNLMYLTRARSQFSAIQTSAGAEPMDAEFFRLACDGLGEPITTEESSRLVAQLAGPSGGVDFQAFVVFILRRRQSEQAELHAPAPLGVTAQKRRGLASRVRINGRGTVFSLGLAKGSQLFSDHAYEAIETPESLRGANFLALPVDDLEVERSDYVSFVPLVELRTFVLIQPRECHPAWLQRDFRHTDEVVIAAAAGHPDLELNVWERRANARPETVVKLGSAQFTPEEWSARRDAVPIVHHNYAVAVLPEKMSRFKEPPRVAELQTRAAIINASQPRARSPNPSGFGSSTPHMRTVSPGGQRVSSPGRRSDKRPASPLPRVATLAKTASPARQRRGSSSGAVSGFGSSSRRDTTEGLVSSDNRAAVSESSSERPKSSTKVRPPPRVSALSPRRERREVKPSTPTGFGSSRPRDTGLGRPVSASRMSNSAVSPNSSFNSVGSRASRASSASRRSGLPRTRDKGSPPQRCLQNDMQFVDLAGVAVLARFNDGQWHEATVVSINTGKRTVVEDESYVKHVVEFTDLIFRSPSDHDASLPLKFATDSAKAEFREISAVPSSCETVSQKLKAEIIRSGGKGHCDLGGQQIGDAGMQLLGKV
eukprot:SAG31_NODE_3906_length_3765_cov_1.595745_4_plen_632_part_01